LSDTPPYAVSEIEEYLFGCHYRWVREEEPTTFVVNGPNAGKDYGGRRYWVFEARDRAKQRQWYVLVGTGTSPFDTSKQMKRWMYARTNDDDLAPEEFLEREYREQVAADAARLGGLGSD
jgi:hypothetical protein